MNFLNQTISGNNIESLKLLPDESVHTCVTSPPYWGLRDYKMLDQLGLEETPEEYVEKMVAVFREVKRVLRKDGTLWLNIGDSYASGKIGRDDHQKFYEKSHGYTGGKKMTTAKQRKTVAGLKQKDLVGIPWMLAFALRADGWYLRQDIIWSKPNPMPEAVTDRCTKAHEYIFLFSKSKKYYFDAEAIKTDAINPEDDKRRFKAQSWDNKNTPDQMKNGLRPRTSGNKERKPGSERDCPEGSGQNVASHVPWEGLKANKRSVWTVTTKPFSGAHFATFPQDLILDCIKAGSPADVGIVLDPFHGSGTTGIVATKLNRNYIGMELNPDYIIIEQKRRYEELGMFR